MDKVSAEIWRSIVQSKPASFFDAPGRILLETFCSAAASARVVSGKLSGLDPEDAEFGRLVRLSAVLTTVLSTMATRLRLCPSSRMRIEDGELTERAAPRSKLLGGMVNN